MMLPGDDERSVFDKFASRVHIIVSKAPFFVVCVAIVVVWVPTLFLMPVDSSQLIINTATTIITFLLVALLNNTAKRGDDATQHKLNAIANYLADRDDSEGSDELRKAIGLEDRERS